MAASRVVCMPSPAHVARPIQPNRITQTDIVEYHLLRNRAVQLVKDLSDNMEAMREIQKRMHSQLRSGAPVEVGLHRAWLTKDDTLIVA